MVHNYVKFIGIGLSIYYYIERFSIECRKTKTRVITLANHKGHG